MWYIRIGQTVAGLIKCWGAKSFGEFICLCTLWNLDMRNTESFTRAQNMSGQDDASWKQKPWKRKPQNCDVSGDYVWCTGLVQTIPCLVFNSGYFSNDWYGEIDRQVCIFFNCYLLSWRSGLQKERMVTAPCSHVRIRFREPFQGE